MCYDEITSETHAQRNTRYIKKNEEEKTNKLLKKQNFLRMDQKDFHENKAISDHTNTIMWLYKNIICKGINTVSYLVYPMTAFDALDFYFRRPECIQGKPSHQHQILAHLFGSHS